MKILIKNANTPEQGICDIGIEGNAILFVGAGPGDFVADETIDASGCIAIPGLVNAHTHAATTLQRNLADDCAFSQWLFEKVIPFENKLSGEDVYWGTMLAVAEMLRSGTTCFADMYLQPHMGKVAQAVVDTGIRANLCYGPIISAVRGDGQIIDEAGCRAYIDAWNHSANGRIKTYVEIHSLFLYDKEALLGAAALAQSLSLPIHMHLSESVAEQEMIFEKYGKTPAQVCLDLNILDVPVLFAHCVQLNDEDIQLLAAKEVYVAHNPTSNLKLGNGIAPIDKMAKAGITVCLGTDGCASNNNLNLFEEMHLAAILHKGVNKDAQCLSAKDVFEMATLNGAKALGFAQCGRLAPGYKADVVLLDANVPHLCPLGDVTAALAYAAQGADVRDVIVDGQILMRNRELKTVDEEKAMFMARQIRGA
ncbi:MAG: amidohydrolase [Defluviitaleaceae bacterium]|nr:amidohydrolase [Defluviitaleaceae bacterium]MCL2240161.1 amidohydrolase [Defluviitaleaceae bacterium]